MKNYDIKIILALMFLILAFLYLDSFLKQDIEVRFPNYSMEVSNRSCIYQNYTPPQTTIVKCNPNLILYEGALLVHGTSMLPVMREGDIVYYKKTRWERNIRENNIIVFTAPENVKISNNFTTISHRVVDVKKDDGIYYFITKGDNNLCEDPWKVRYEDILGIVACKVENV